MSDLALPLPATRCTSCGTELAATLLICPACHALVHRERLQTLARDADAAAAQNDFARAASMWREVFALLPEGSKQREQAAERVDRMTAAAEGRSLEEVRKGPPGGSMWAKVLAPLGVAGLLIWKFKFVLVALLTKGKLLLLGLTKFSTIASLFVSLGVYWSAWGWKFAAAILGGIYIHEMGHVAELRRRGMAASAPMFVPGVGAFVRMHEHAATPSEDARIGLAGPIWGLGAALVALAISLYTDSNFWAVIAQVTAVINLFNLTPVWQLDGSRGFHAFSRVQRWMVLAAIAVAYALSREGMLVIVGLVAVWRALERNVKTSHDWPALATYVVLLAALSTLAIK